MTNNEANFVNIIVNHDKYIGDIQSYIKENFNIESSYDEETNTIHLWTTNINESLQLNSAKKYILDEFTENLINVKFGKK